MSPLSTSVFITFLVVVALGLVVPFLTRRVASSLNFKLSGADLKGAAFVFVPALLALAAVAAMGGLPWMALAFFAGAFLLPAALTRIGLPPFMVGVAVFAASVLTTMNIDKGAAVALECAMAGLLLFKLAENIFVRPGGVVEDVLPALAWLGGLYWINAATLESALAMRQGLLLGAIEVGIVMRLVQGPFLGDDKLYVKRLVLAATAGLLLLIYITKVLVAPSLELAAAVFAGAVLSGYLIDEADHRSESGMSAHHALKILILIGIFTVLSSRLFGTLGWVLIAPVAITAVRPGAAACAGMFFISRLMLQGYLVLYNPNVTGINITHAYAGAALYGGMLLSLLLSLFLRDVRERQLSLWISAAAAVVLPLAADYFLHAEATSSLLASMTVATVLLAVAAPTLYRSESSEQNNLMLFPPLMVAVASLGSALIDLGNAETQSARVMVLGYVAAATFVLMVVGMWRSGRSTPKQVEVAGD